MNASRTLVAFRRWIDSEAAVPSSPEVDPRRIDWPRVLPFIAIHVACLGAIATGVSGTAVAVAALLRTG